MGKTLLIRADASTEIGTGHVMRCLALAQAWQDSGGNATLAAAALPPAVAERLGTEGVTVHALTVASGSLDDAQQTAALAHDMAASWVVVDGYQFGADYQRLLKAAGLRVLFIDDYGHAESYCADLVLNQNSYADESLYANRDPSTCLLLGPRYVLLRREFWPWRGWRREIVPVARKILVTLGGSDPDNVTLEVLQALNLVEVSELDVVVIVGGGNPHAASLEDEAQYSRHKIRLERNVTNMPELMAWADLAISAGGSTCCELAFMGLPTCMIVLNENQQPLVAALAAAGIGWDLGWHYQFEGAVLAKILNQVLITPNLRASMSSNGQAVIDGFGSNRICAAFHASTLQLRQAKTTDCRLLWEWANDPLVRAASFSSDVIRWDQHVVWFTNCLASSQHFIFIGTVANDIPVGQVRFEIIQDKAVISVSLDQSTRGCGYASRLISLGANVLFRNTAVVEIDAYIKPQNEASRRAFERAGFSELKPTVICGHQALHLVLYRERGFDG